MKKLFMISICLPLLLWSCGGEESGKESKTDDGLLEISTKAVKGAKYKMFWNRKENISGIDPMSKKEATSVNEMKMEIAQEVTDVDAEGNYTVTGVYTKFWTSFELGGMKVEFDATQEIPKDAAPEMIPMFQGMKDILGKKTVMVFDKKGHVKSITGDPTYMDMMFPDSNYRQLDNVREMIELDAVYPNEKVKVGDSWNYKSAMRNNYPMVVDQKCTLKKRDSGMLTIEVDGKVSPNPNQVPSPDMMGGSFRMDLSGERKATYTVNESDGMCYRSVSTFDLKGDEILVDPKTKKETKHPMTLKLVDDFTLSIGH